MPVSKKLVDLLRPIRSGYKVAGKDIVLAKRPDSKYWQIRVYIKETKRYKSFSSQTEDANEALVIAFEKKAKIDLDIERGIVPFAATFKKVTELWMRQTEELAKNGTKSKHTFSIYKSIAKIHLIPFFGKVLISRMKSEFINSYKNESGLVYGTYLPAQSKARKVWSHHQVTLGLIMKFAQEKGFYKHVVIPKIEFPLFDEKEDEDDGGWARFQDHEIDIIMANFDQFIKSMKTDMQVYNAKNMKAWVTFMVHSGCRPHDLGKLKWMHVELRVDKRTVFRFSDYPKGVDPHPSSLIMRSGLIAGNIHVANERANVYVYLTGKKRKRSISIDVEYLETLMWWLTESKYQKPEDLVFAMYSGTWKRSADIFKEYLKFLGIPDKTSDGPRVPYSLRHTFITKKLIEGVMPWDIAEHCGNSVDQIQKTYRQMLPEELYDKIFRPILK